jgi:hypothetical protein
MVSPRRSADWRLPPPGRVANVHGHKVFMVGFAKQDSFGQCEDTHRVLGLRPKTHCAGGSASLPCSSPFRLPPQAHNLVQGVAAAAGFGLCADQV